MIKNQWVSFNLKQYNYNFKTSDFPGFFVSNSINLGLQSAKVFLKMAAIVQPKK